MRLVRVARLVLGIVLTACAAPATLPTSATPIPTDIPTLAAAPTFTPAPTATITVTATRVPLGALDIEPLLVQDGDLPAGYVAGQVSSDYPPMFYGIPRPDRTVSRELGLNGRGAGLVTVLLYERPDQLEAAYQFLLGGFGPNAEAVLETGERAQAVDSSGNWVDLVFVRCRAVVHIRLTQRADVPVARDYAQRLDARLQPLICN